MAIKLKRYASSFAPLSEALNELAAAIEFVGNRSFHAGKGLVYSQTDDGVMVDFIGNTGGGDSGGSLRPWDLFAKTADGTNYLCKVVPGTIAGFIPSNMFAEFTAASTGTVYFKVKCQTNGKQITSCLIEVNATAPPSIVPTLEALPSEFYVMFGIMLDGVMYRTIGDGNPQVFSYLAFELPKTTTPSPGMSPYERWYSWSVSK